jgi:hypothetical protein
MLTELCGSLVTEDLRTSTENEGDAGYASGYSEAERQRLIPQGSFLWDFTDRLFSDTGLGPGMCVLRSDCRLDNACGDVLDFSAGDTL